VSAFESCAAMVAVLLVLIALRMPIALATGLVGAGAYVLQSGWLPLSAYLKTAMVDKFTSYDLAVVPLFILMGQIATKTGMSRDLFAAANQWLGHRRGGLAMAAVAACGAFGAICGSSIATASTMTQVSLPEMRRHGYSNALSAGALAAGGTLGILIPPSIVLIIYALLTEQNIVKLFLAATVPGLLAIVGFVLAIAVYVRLFPKEGSAGKRVPWGARFRGLARVWHVLLLFVAVLGGIYGGVFTPAQGASVGVILTLAIGIAMRAVTPRALFASLIETAGTSAMIFAIIFGADLFNVGLALTRAPALSAEWLGEADIAPMLVLVVLILFYLVMGCVMDSLSLILLTVPVFFPAFMTLDFGLTYEHQALWFGVISLVVVELGMITPPVGLNLFIILSMAPDIRTREVYRGVMPFIAAEFVRIVLLVALPVLTWGLIALTGG